MAYIPKNWVNETPQTTPIRFTIRDAGGNIIHSGVTIELETIVTPGTPVDATNLNHIEQGIVAVETKVDAVQAQANTGVPKIITGRGQIPVGTGNNAITPLPVGSNNQILMADNTEPAGIKWANRASGLLSAKGDIFAASAANTAARVPVGAPGTYLIPKASAATGMAWEQMFWIDHLTSTSWDGDAKAASTIYNITVGTVFPGVPNTAKMVHIWLAARWSSGIGGDAEMYATPFGLSVGNKYRFLTVRGQVVNQFADACGWVPIDSAGRFSIQTAPVAPTNVYMEVNAYML